MSSKPTRRTVRTRSARPRSLVFLVESLEGRSLLSTLPAASPMFVVDSIGPYGGGSPGGGYTPAQIQQAYGISSSLGNGAGETIAIVDAYDDPNIQSDLNTFDAQFGLPAVTVNKVNQTGGTSLPAADSSGGWELEESLDVEWAHAIAPGANIMLVEANSSSLSDLLQGVSYAASHANVVSMSWGGSEFSGQTSYDSTFSHSGTAFVASSGDSGAPVSWPASSPNVLAVGGTQLTLNSSGGWGSETGWSGSGGGPSAYETMPTYQNGVVTSTTMRANPDVAYNADPSTGYAVYDSVPYSGTTYDWLTVGGTSAGAPQWSALLAIADEGRAAAGQPALDSTNPQQVMTILYQNPKDFHDITSGTSTGTPNYTAGPGYDYVTGLGSPMANLIIGSLEGSTATPTPTPSISLAISTPASVTAGSSFSVTVTADEGSTVDTGYTGTVKLTSTDGKAILPPSYTFSSADHGSHTFTVTLETAGSQTVTATDTSGSATAATSPAISVSPAKATQFVLAGLPSSAAAGASETFTLTAKDAYGNVATGYTGTVSFTSTDSHAHLPATYTFTTANAGTHSFSVTFETAGSQTVTAKDSASNISATSSAVSVTPAAPTGLTASTASSSQINLAWTGSAGATGYLIQESMGGGSSWTQIGSTASTSYQATGLTAGTTYEFRVLATWSNLTSPASSVASATTSGTAPSADTLWANSYVPPENAYAYGYYEVGVKFTSSQAGEVTGLRFYKQTWMGGYLHVGHLWSSSGALLATATFSNETSYGWQQVNLTNPVTIQANTEYIVSFSTGGGYFGITTGYFNGGGASNGPLQAPSESTPGGDGVYNYQGYFPNVDGSGMNFWADVAFKPATITTAVVTATTGVQTAAVLGTTVPTSTSSTNPSGPARHYSGWRSTAAAVTQQAGSNASTFVASRTVVTQDRQTVRWGPRGTSFLGS
ncbi:MAG: DUF4082 domain-containing protein [Isosphaeraceae bacterium]